MSRPASDLLAEAVGLPVAERLKLASDLIASVDGTPDPDWDAAWLAELDRRVAAARTRGAPAPEWSEVRARILDRLARR